jgi:hypothetical protein
MVWQLILAWSINNDALRSAGKWTLHMPRVQFRAADRRHVQPPLAWMAMHERTNRHGDAWSTHAYAQADRTNRHWLTGEEPFKKTDWRRFWLDWTGMEEGRIRYNTIAQADCIELAQKSMTLWTEIPSRIRAYTIFVRHDIWLMCTPHNKVWVPIRRPTCRFLCTHTRFHSGEGRDRWCAALPLSCNGTISEGVDIIVRFVYRPNTTVDIIVR